VIFPLKEQHAPQFTHNWFIYFALSQIRHKYLFQSA